jgi:hypothetical protein
VADWPLVVNLLLLALSLEIVCVLLISDELGEMCSLSKSTVVLCGKIQVQHLNDSNNRNTSQSEWVKRDGE